MRYLIDTDWAMHYLNDRPDIVRRLRALQDDGLALSLTSLAKLYEGVFYSRDPEGDERDLQDFLRGVTVLGIDDSICRIFGRERGRLRTAGTLIGDFDLLIGATALHHNLTLLTDNRRYLERIDGLRIESL